MVDTRALAQKAARGIRFLVRPFKAKEIIAVPQVTDRGKLLENKVALITGGSGGIGSAIAESFLRSGCKVIVAGTNEEKLDRIVNSLSKKTQAGGVYGAYRSTCWIQVQ